MVGFKLFLVTAMLFSAFLILLAAHTAEGSRDQDAPQAQAMMDPPPTPTSFPTYLPTALPLATATPTPMPTTTPAPTPTPTPIPDANLSLVFDTTGGAASGEEELRFEFTVTNESLGPASGVMLVFEVSGAGSLASARSVDGPCDGATCDLGSFDGHESVTGHLVVQTNRGFDSEVDVYADLSWRLRNSNRRHSYAEAIAMLADNNQPGDLIWASPVRASSGSCGDSVSVGPDRLYAGFGRHLYSVARSDGEELWLAAGDSSMFQPVLADGSIYFHARQPEAEGYYIRSLDALEGTLNWEYSVNGNARGPAVVYGGSVYYTVNRPGIDGRSAYSYLLSLDASTGILNWQYRVDKWINTSAVEFGGNIYFGTYTGGDDYLYSIDPKSGELNQRYQTAGGSYFTPQIADESAYILSGYGPVHSMDLSTGKKNWEYLPKGRVSAAPLLADGTLHFHVDDEAARENYFVQALDAATGRLKWQYEVGPWLMPPMASNGSVYVPTYDGLVSLDAVTGSLNWQAAYDTICGRLTAADGVLYGRATIDNWYIVFAIRAD